MKVVQVASSRKLAAIAVATSAEYKTRLVKYFLRPKARYLPVIYMASSSHRQPPPTAQAMCLEKTEGYLAKQSIVRFSKTEIRDQATRSKAEKIAPDTTMHHAAVPKLLFNSLAFDFAWNHVSLYTPRCWKSADNRTSNPNRPRRPRFSSLPLKVVHASFSVGSRFENLNYAASFRSR